VSNVHSTRALPTALPTAGRTPCTPTAPGRQDQDRSSRNACSVSGSGTVDSSSTGHSMLCCISLRCITQHRVTRAGTISCPRTRDGACISGTTVLVLPTRSRWSTGGSTSRRESRWESPRGHARRSTHTKGARPATSMTFAGDNV
jgi:hypothetical protein